MTLTIQRTSSTSVVFGSYNMLNLYADPSEEPRWRRVYDVIKSMDADVLAIQELIADDPKPDDPDADDKVTAAGKRLQELAEATGLQCTLPNGQPALAAGNHRFHVGLLWKKGITPVGGFGAYSGSNTWHSLVKVHLDVGGHIVQHASYHAPPFGRYRRADEAERVLSIMTRPDRPGKKGDRPPGLIAGDWNGISADRIRRPGAVAGDGSVLDEWVLYDKEPYHGKVEHGDLVYQTRWTFDANGVARQFADREPGEVLYLGGLRDVAAALNAPWETTVGHWPDDDPYGERRIDIVRATHDVVPALRSYAVLSKPTSDAGPGGADPKEASDHLPILVEYEPSAIVERLPAADS